MEYRDFIEVVLGIIGEFGMESRIVFEKSGGNYTAEIEDFLFTSSQWASHIYMANLKSGEVTEFDTEGNYV